jgi:hypothetical protein
MLLEAMKSAAPVSKPSAPLDGSAVSEIWVSIEAVAGVVSCAALVTVLVDGRSALGASG